MKNMIKYRPASTINRPPLTFRRGNRRLAARPAAAGFAAGASGRTVFAAGASGSTGLAAGASGSTGFTSGFEVGCVLFVSSDILFEGINSCTLRYIA